MAQGRQIIAGKSGGVFAAAVANFLSSAVFAFDFSGSAQVFDRLAICKGKTLFYNCQTF